MSRARANEAPGRSNQRKRTRKDLLEAAARLMQRGVKPSFDEVAEEALVSRATAYRYFPTIEALLLEATLDVAAPDPETIFAREGETDALARVIKVDEAFDAMIKANEPALRLMLAQTLERSVRAEADADAPLRQNRRTPLIEAALAPARGEFKPASYALLQKALALIIGTEGAIALKDVLQVDEAEARRIKRWAIRALIEAARA